MTQLEPCTTDEGLYDNTVPSTVEVVKRKNVKSFLRKAPQAPKRFRSSYIFFFEANEKRIKTELGVHASAPEVSKRVGELWRTLTEGERKHWENEAAKDMERFMNEKATYTGPWQLPQKRAKKDPTAPKRNSSAFLLYSKKKRSELRKSNPGMKNTEISGLLGKLWRSMPAEEKRPHVEREKEERQQYKVAMAEWKRKKKQEDLINSVAPSMGGRGENIQFNKVQRIIAPMNSMHRGGGEYDSLSYGRPPSKNPCGYNRGNNHYASSSEQVWYGQQYHRSPPPMTPPHYDRNYAFDSHPSGQYPQDHQDSRHSQSSRQREQLSNINEISPTPYRPNYPESRQMTPSPFQHKFFPPSPPSSRDNHSQSQKDHSYNRGTTPPPTMPRISSLEFSVPSQPRQQKDHSLSSNGYDKVETLPVFPDYDQFEPVHIHR